MDSDTAFVSTDSLKLMAHVLKENHVLITVLNYKMALVNAIKVWPYMETIALNAQQAHITVHLSANASQFAVKILIMTIIKVNACVLAHAD
jgi:hypothetical protein